MPGGFMDQLACLAAVAVSACCLVAGAGAVRATEPPRTSPGIVLFDWRETARLEHEDRKARFQRIAREGQAAPPLFFESLVDARQVAGLKAEVPILRLVYPEAILFDTDRSEIRPEMRRVLVAVAKALRSDSPDTAVFIAGHTDARGSDDYNYHLSVERADAVARALYGLGIGSVRLWRVGFGKAVPIAPNDSDANMARNRRVEFIFAAKPEAVALWLSRQSVSICEGLVPAYRDQCRFEVARLPPVRAEPVISVERTPIRPLGTREDLELSGARELVVPSAVRAEGRAGAGAGVAVGEAAAQRTVPIADPREIVTIDRRSPVVIDIRNQKVTVGAPIP